MHVDSRTEVGGVDPAIIVTARDPWCGLIARVRADEMVQEILKHFTHLHPQIHDPAPYVTVEVMRQEICDACLAPAERPWWNHTMNPPMDKDLVDKDGKDEWLVCLDCHKDLRAGNVINLVKRWVRLKKIESPYLFMDKDRSMELRHYMAGIFSELILRSDEGQLETKQPGT